MLSRCGILMMAVLFAGCALGEDRAAQAYLSGDLRTAEKLLRKEITADRGDVRPSRYLLLARVTFMQEEWTSTRKTLETLQGKDPDNAAARELLARTLFRLREFEEAQSLYEETLREADKPELCLEYADLLIELGRETDAVAALKRVIRDNRAWPRAHYLLGKLRLESGLGHWAARELWIAQQLKYPAEDLHLRLAQAFFQEGRVTGCLREQGPLEGVAPGVRGGEYIVVAPSRPGQDRFWLVADADTALYQVEQSLAEHPSVSAPEARLLAARCWLAAGDTQLAARYAADGKPSPGLFDLRARIALADGDTGSFAGILKSSRPAKRPEPETVVDLLLEAALAAEVRGEPDAALEFVRRADGLLPGRSDVLRLMVDVLTHAGQTDEAASAMHRLTELHPDSPEVRLLAARHKVDYDALQEEGKAFFGPDSGPAAKEDR